MYRRSSFHPYPFYLLLTRQKIWLNQIDIVSSCITPPEQMSPGERELDSKKGDFINQITAWLTTIGQDGGWIAGNHANRRVGRYERWA